MKRKFAVFDIDGTLIRWQLYHAVVNELVKRHKLPEAVGESIQAARMTWKRRENNDSFRDYEQHLWRSYVAAVSGLTVEDTQAAIDTVFETYKDQIYTYTRDLVHRLKGEGYLLFAVSGSHQEIVEKLGEYYGFDATVGTVYPHDEHSFSGEETSVVGQKDKTLRQLVSQYDATWEDSFGVGDSASDAAMLELVSHPVAFNPNQELFTTAREKGWKVVVERKNMIYELENRHGTYVLAETGE